MNHRLLPFAICAVLPFTGCNVVPQKFPDVAARTDLKAIDSTRITVRSEFRYMPSLTTYVVPVGDYVPVRSDAGGTYYESPKGIFVTPAVGSFVAPGGIYRRKDSKANYPFAIYVDAPGSRRSFIDLHSMWGLNLNEKIECDPPYVFE